MQITDGQLGIALFFLSLGTLAMIPISPKLISRLGAGKATMIGILVFALAFQLPLFMGSFTLLCLSLFIVGLCSSFTDISMNAMVSDIEQRDGVYFMSAAHGFFSLGGVIGAGIGSLIIVFFRYPQMHMFLAMVFVVITNILVAKSYRSVVATPTKIKQAQRKISVYRTLTGLAIISFVIMGSEGAIEHWSKLYMQDVVMETSDQISGFGFVVFSIAMTLGRFYGDALSNRFGSYTIILAGCMLAVIGFLALFQNTVLFALIGFSLIGIGYSVIIPELFRLAGKSSVPSATGISFVAGIGYIGFLASPAIMGFLSEMESLKLSFTTLMISTILMMIIVFILYKRQKA